MDLTSAEPSKFSQAGEVIFNKRAPFLTLAIFIWKGIRLYTLDSFQKAIFSLMRKKGSLMPAPGVPQANRAASGPASA